MEIKRDRYLQQLIESRQDGFIKVVTGIRRCGKSYLLNVLFYHYLLENGIADDHIIRIDLEDRMNKDLRNPDMMLHYVHDRIKDKELYYIIIDEVQPVSYTHLRAHETGRNLVCRLLLEKKNENSVEKSI